MDALDALRTRRSVREYAAKPVAREDLEAMVDCARLAATANNLQPWEFVVVTESAALRRIAAATDYGRQIGDAGACVAVFCKDTKYYLEDGCAATQNLLVAARALGLGTCWIAGDKKRYAGQVADLLGAPGGYKLVSLVAVGHPAAVPDPVKRPLGDVLHWEHF